MCSVCLLWIEKARAKETYYECYFLSCWRGERVFFFLVNDYFLWLTETYLIGKETKMKVMRRGFPSEKELSCSCCKSRNICCIDCKAAFTIFSKAAKPKDLKSPGGNWSVIEEKVRMIVLWKKRVNFDTANAICLLACLVEYFCRWLSVEHAERRMMRMASS